MKLTKCAQLKYICKLSLWYFAGLVFSDRPSDLLWCNSPTKWQTLNRQALLPLTKLAGSISAI